MRRAQVCATVNDRNLDALAATKVEAPAGQLAVPVCRRLTKQRRRYDNARAESFFSTLKVEHTYRHHFADHTQARQATFEWIEAFYNLRRRHSSIGYLSPVDFENQSN